MQIDSNECTGSNSTGTASASAMSMIATTTATGGMPSYLSHTTHHHSKDLEGEKTGSGEDNLYDSTTVEMMSAAGHDYSTAVAATHTTTTTASASDTTSDNYAYNFISATTATTASSTSSAAVVAVNVIPLDHQDDPNAAVAMEINDSEAVAIGTLTDNSNINTNIRHATKAPVAVAAVETGDHILYKSDFANRKVSQPNSIYVFVFTYLLT
jgi:hypothetical protein